MAWWQFGKGRGKDKASAPAAKAEASHNHDLLERVFAFLSDEMLQNGQLPQWLQEEIGKAPAVDQVPGGSGEFGRDMNNPVPVNGPFGAAQYLSSLITAAGQPIAFQCFGTSGRVDVYETVSFDGREWDFLYLTKYFPRKSTLAPRGYRFAGKDERGALIKGVNDQAEDFPFATHVRVARYTNRVVGAPIADPRLKALDTLKYRIPEAHVRQLERLRFGANLTMHDAAT